MKSTILLALSLVLFPLVPTAEAASCCTPQSNPGCDDAGVESCVCAQDDYCCSSQWDAYCVNEVEDFGCGSCASGPSCGDGTCDSDETCDSCPDDCGWCSGGDCCEPQGAPGCGDYYVMDCVCAQDSFCCQSEWDSYCVNEIAQFGCGSCSTGPGCGDGSCDGGETCSSCPDDCGPCGTGDCCKAQSGPGCQDAAIAACVCADDSYCCSTKWDSVCAGEVTELGCGSCGGTGGCGDGSCSGGETCEDCPDDCGYCQGTGDCCAAQTGPGCGDAAVSSCVCGQDSYCCSVTWDAYCVTEVEEFGCGSCGGAGDACPGYTGTSYCCKKGDPCGWGSDGLCDCDSTCDWDQDDCGGGTGCGDGKCGAGETCTSCPEDCGYCAGTGDCCAAHDSVGCKDATIQNCVCDQDSYCCTTQWDGMCAAEVESMGCGECAVAPDCGDGTCSAGESCQTCPEDCGSCGSAGDCCEVHDGKGCKDSTIQACVCNQDSFCCNYTWDDICVSEVEQFGCGSCSGGPACGDGACDADEDCLVCPDDCGPCSGEACCTPHESAGCDDQAVTDCVCKKDAYCCTTKWDSICAGEVTSFGCGTCDSGPACGDGKCAAGESCKTCPDDCGPCGGQGDCCTPQETGGCSDATVQACVCQLDSYCCQTAWDDICVQEVTSEGCGTCGECTPDCAGKQCGNDGCGGTCGKCPQNQSCQNNHCVAGDCTPKCQGMECGDDGCGGTCGTCPPGKKCQAGKCAASCQPNCEGKQCGTDGCGGTCGQCPPNFFCDAGHCAKTCEPKCTGKQCGSDGCGGTCGSCQPGFTCSADGHCQQGCVPDCNGKQCGSDGCGGTCGSCPPSFTCSNGHCTSGCTPSCTGKQCGDDGCGGSCGTCNPGDYCNLQGHCVTNCQPNCTGKECGSDGCGGSCGTCGFQEACNAQSQCEAICVPNCLGKECGEDGCGGKCGVCGFQETCTNLGLCIACTPDCEGRECGDNGCEGECGECDKTLACDEESGQCVDPSLIPPVEGDSWTEDDGNSYGPCKPGERMIYGKCVAAAEDDVSVDTSGCSAGARSQGAWLLALLLLVLPSVRLLRGRPTRSAPGSPCE